MHIFEPLTNVSLSVHCTKKYNNMTFDGCSYYFTIQGSFEIIETDGNFHIQKTFTTCREYDCICFDFREQCFWASSKKQSTAIYKLNCHMCEIDYITINGNGQTTGDITGLSCNCCDDTLFVAYANCILSMNKQCQSITLRYQSQYMQITSVLSLCPGLMITGMKNCEQYVYLLDEGATIAYAHPVPCDIVIKNMVFNPCVAHGAQACLDFFVLKKGCYPYMNRYCLHTDEFPFTPCHCNFEICHNQGCAHAEEQEACSAVLTSIALVEASLAHILNAEGEKLQKVLAQCEDIDTILMVNREVNKTIVNATQLEYTLFAKLSALMEYCPDPHCHSCHPKPTPCGCADTPCAPCQDCNQSLFHSCAKEEIQESEKQA